MPNYELMSMSELYTDWINNWTAMATGLSEILGDTPMPDPREVARLMVEMPEETWVDLFTSEKARAELRKTMDLQKLLAEMQTENVQILDAALNRKV